MIAHRVVNYEFAGKGSIIQALGILCPFIGFWLAGYRGISITILAGIFLFILGSILSRVWKCSNCMNKLYDKEVKICPVCKVPLE